MTKDRIYADAPGPHGSFVFDESVACVFPDMLERSIPGYRASIEAIGSLASRYVRENSRCYDLGCSLGAAALAMRANIGRPGCSIVAVDNSPAMVRRCAELVAAQREQLTEIELRQADIRAVDISNASMVVMNYTLQFLPPAERAGMLRKIFDGLLDGGLLVLSEKVVDEDEAMEAILVELHHEFKRRNDYSELEIARKRTALENVLIPDTLADHLSRLRQAGFAHAGIWMRYLNFVSILAIR